MFLKRSVLKSLMKEAYKSGLDIGRDGKFLFLAGRYWEAEIHMSAIPKETLGDIISLIGELPREDEYFSATKDGLQEIFPRVINPEEFPINDLEITNTIQIGTEGTLQRVLQDCTNGNVYFINEAFMALIHRAFPGGETAVEGPFADPHGVLFRNNTCMLHVYFRVDPKNEDITQTLSQVDIIPRRHDEKETEVDPA